MNDNLTKMLSKVAALRALAARATTQAEAEAAAAQAAAICAKYQIDEAEIEAADPSRAEVVGESEVLHTSKRVDAWTGILASGLSKVHGCACVASRGGGVCSYRVAGRPSDVAIVRYLFAWLSVEIARLAAREHGRAAVNAFRVGAAQGAVNAMRRSQATVVQAASTGTAMVLAGRAGESMDYLKAAIGGRFAATKARVTDNGTFFRGMAAGEQLRPSVGLGSGGGPLRLGK